MTRLIIGYKVNKQMMKILSYHSTYQGARRELKKIMKEEHNTYERKKYVIANEKNVYIKK
jgi:hypothetical protein